MVNERWWEKWTWMPTPPTTTLRSRWTCPCRKQRSRYCWHLGDSCLLISLFKNCRFSKKFVLTDITAKCPLLQKNPHCLANDFTLKLLFYLFHTCSSITKLQQVWYLMSFDHLTFQVCWRSLTEKGKYFSLKTKMNNLLPLSWLNKRS